MNVEGRHPVQRSAWGLRTNGVNSRIDQIGDQVHDLFKTMKPVGCIERD
jgi:hypothetical protein